MAVNSRFQPGELLVNYRYSSTSRGVNREVLNALKIISVRSGCREVRVRDFRTLLHGAD
jgi:hypothetical protein